MRRFRRWLRLGFFLLIGLLAIGVYAQSDSATLFTLQDTWEFPVPPDSGISYLSINPDKSTVLVVYQHQESFNLTDNQKQLFAQTQSELWDMTTRTKIATLPNETVNIWGAMIDNSGQYILIQESFTRDNQRYSLWDAHTGESIRTIQGHITNGTISADGNLFIYFDVPAMTTFVMDISTGDMIAQTDQFAKIWAIGHHPDQPILALANEVERPPAYVLFYDVYLWNYATDEVTLIDNTNPSISLSRLIFLSDPNYLSFHTSGMRFTYDLSQPTYPRVDVIDFRQSTYDRDSYLLSFTADNLTPPFVGYVYDIITNTRLATVSEGPIGAAVFFSPDDHYFFGILMSELHQWDAQTGVHLGMVYFNEFNVGRDVDDFTFTADGEQLWIFSRVSPIVLIFSAGKTA